MLQYINRYYSLVLAGLGFILMIMGLLDSHPLGSGIKHAIIGALLFVGGFVIYYLIYLIDLTKGVRGGLSNLNRLLQTQVPEPVIVEEEKPAIVDLPEPKFTPFVFPTFNPPKSEPLSEVVPVEVKPSVTSKKDFFSEIPQDISPAASEYNATPEEIKQEQAALVPVSPEERFKESNNRLSQIAKDFPELDAILRKDREPVAPPQPVIETPPAISIIREGTISGIPFTLFSDGSIEAEIEDGRHRFAGINDFRKHVEGA